MRLTGLRQLVPKLEEMQQFWTPKAAVLLTVSVASIIVNTGAIVIPIDWLAIVISFVSVFVVPGYLLLRLFLGEEWTISWLEWVPVSFVLGVGLLSPIGLLALLLHLNLEVLGWLTSIVNTILIGLCILRWKKVIRSVHASSEQQPNFFLLGVFSLLGMVILYLFLSTASTWTAGDLWYLSYIRRYLNTTSFTEFDLRASWWILQALIDHLAKVEPLDAFRFYLPSLLLVVSLTAFSRLAYQLFDNWNAAMLAMAIQILYYVSSIGSHHWIGRGFFDRIVEDKFLIWLIILFVVILLMLRYLAEGKTRYLVLFSLSVSALTFSHPLGLVQGGISIASFASVSLLSNRTRKQLLRLMFIFIILFVFLVVPLAQRQLIITSDHSDTAFSYASGMVDIPARFYLAQVRLWMFSAVENLYMAHPHLIGHPLTLAAILLTPLLLRYLHKDIAAQYLFSNMALPLGVLYNPLTAPLLGRLITPWMLYRLTWAFPVSLTITFFLIRIGHWSKRSLLKHSFFASKARLMALMPVLAIVVVTISLQAYIGDGLNFLQERKVRGLSTSQRELLNHLSECVVPDSGIMAEPNMNPYIPAFVPADVLTANLGPVSPATEDVARFYQTDLVNSSLLDTLDRWRVRYVVIERRHDLAFQFDALPQLFDRCYANAGYALYEVLHPTGAHPVVTGNTYLMRGDLEAAIAEYEAALALDPQDRLAYLGLGRAYRAMGQEEAARRSYHQAVELYPGNFLARLELAQVYAGTDEGEKAIDLLRETIQLRPDYLPAFEALGDLYLARGWQEAALAEYRHAVDDGPVTGDFHLALADLYWRKGLQRPAITEYRAAADSPLWKAPDRGRGTAYLALARVYQAEGQDDQAVIAYERAIAYEPSLQPAYTALGELYLAEGQSKQALALYRAASQRNLNLAWPHLELGKVYLRQMK
jgi:tetratricopeptide (TPR) repeat protein